MDAAPCGSRAWRSCAAVVRATASLVPGTVGTGRGGLQRAGGSKTNRTAPDGSAGAGPG